MTIVNAFILGMIQGLTEFLPISSSGHLLIIPRFLNLPRQSVSFDVLVHVATALAVIIYFREDIARIILKGGPMLWLLIIGTIPTALMGYFGKSYITGVFRSSVWVGVFLIVTGSVLWFAESWSKKVSNKKQLSWLDAIFVGFMQGLAILPGLSRSGMTVSGGLLRGISRGEAARFAFLLSVPAILGAALVEAGNIRTLALIPAFIGFCSALGFGLIAIHFFLRQIKRGKLHIFSWYCWILGFIVIVWFGIL